MRILISGASGFIGAPLSSYLLKNGHELTFLVRKAPSNSHQPFLIWDFLEHPLTLAPFEGFDAVIHLVGDPLTLAPWSRFKKKQIKKSRVETTKAIARVLASLKNPPKLFLSASAIGFYGDQKEEVLTENSSKGHGFLAEVCEEWERASDAIPTLTRKVFARFGMVLGPNGGALKKLSKIYSWWLGAKIGSGKQWISWIHIDDLIRALDHILHQEKLIGPVNLVSLHPVRQEEFSEKLAQILGRKAFFWVPGVLLKLFLGTSAEEMLLASTRVLPEKLVESDFQFKYLNLDQAFESIFKKSPY